MRNTILALLVAPCLAGAAMLDRQAVLEQRAQASFASTVDKAKRHDRALGAAELFQAAFYFCETGRYLDQLDLLFDVAAEMQDRDPASRTFGNFRWSWRDGFVMDLNAVDFCMQTGSLLARDHLDKLSPAQKEKFLAILDRAIAGCLAHRVRDSYTNIAIMNAANLILLGEARNRRDVFEEGVKRLDAFTLDVALFGVCEYASPTYTAVDIVNLHRLHAYVRDPSVRDRAERLLKLFYTDICASSFAPAGRLAGTHSRDYDYLYGMGGVAALLRAIGVAAPIPGPPERPMPELVLSDWRPPASITSLASLAPRFIVSFWGEDDDSYRTLWVGRHIALGVSGANYWNMDIPLAVDFASPKRKARGYFIADARRDPYGLKKIPEGNGPHQKTLHLRPFWCGVQRGRDALGLVVYRPGDVPPDSPTLESHFVFPCDVDEICIGDTPLKPTRGHPFAHPLKPGDCVFVRHGSGACAVRVAWSRGITGDGAPAAVVWDDVPDVNALRLTVAHHDFWGRPMDTANPPAAALWVRVTDDASTPLHARKVRRLPRRVQICNLFRPRHGNKHHAQGLRRRWSACTGDRLALRRAVMRRARAEACDLRGQRTRHRREDHRRGAGNRRIPRRAGACHQGGRRQPLSRDDAPCRNVGGASIPARLAGSSFGCRAKSAASTTAADAAPSRGSSTSTRRAHTTSGDVRWTPPTLRLRRSGYA